MFSIQIHHIVTLYLNHTPDLHINFGQFSFFYIFHHFQIFWRHFLFLKISFFFKKNPKNIFSKLTFWGHFGQNLTFFSFDHQKKSKNISLTRTAQAGFEPTTFCSTGEHSTSKPNWLRCREHYILGTFPIMPILPISPIWILNKLPLKFESWTLCIQHSNLSYCHTIS